MRSCARLLPAIAAASMCLRTAERNRTFPYRERGNVLRPRRRSIAIENRARRGKKLQRAG
jgi:hypothetical protein